MRLEWGGRRYVVAAEPVRWYERRKWWIDEPRIARGHGAGLVDREVWRLQVHLERAGNAPLHSLDIAHHADSGRWQLLQSHGPTR